MALTIIRGPRPQASQDPSLKPAPPPEGNAPEPEYRVGYGRPPRHTQFRKGQSGNPKGRSKGIKNSNTILAEELAMPIKVQEFGKQKTVSKAAAVVKTLVAKALSGDVRAISAVLKMLPLADQGNRERAQAHDVDATDRQILDAFREQLLSAAARSREDD